MNGPPASHRSGARALFPAVLFTAVLLPVVLLPGCAADESAPAGPAFDVLRDVGFATPESVVHDPVADVYLVTNIAGDPFAKDGEAFISRVRPSGEVELRWIASGQDGVELHAPKGIAVGGDVLWVADIDTVRTFDRATGRPRAARTIEGATFLNDVAIGPDGAVWVSDSGFAPGFEPSGTDAVWRLDAELNATKVLSGADLGHPNGLCAGTNDLFLVTWDGRFGPVPDSGEFRSATLPKAQLDGLVRTPDGRWFVSSWEGRCVYRVSPDGSAEVVVEDLDTPADIGFDGKRGALLIPSFQGDMLTARVP